MRRLQSGGTRQERQARSGRPLAIAESADVLDASDENPGHTTSGKARSLSTRERTLIRAGAHQLSAAS